MNLRLLLPLLLVAGCVTTPPVSSSVRVDPAARPQCEQHCGALGMKMTAVVIYSNRTGCVCEPVDAPAPSSAVSSTKAGAAVSAAGEVVNEEEESQRQHSQSQQRASGGGYRR
jgi:hypothetical protein